MKVKRGETKEEKKVVEKQRNEPVIIEELKEELIVEESMRKESIAKEDLKENSITEELFIEESPVRKSTNETNQKTKVSNKNLQKKTDIVEANKSSESFHFEENSSCSDEDFGLDNEMTARESLAMPLVQEMDQKSSQKLYAKTKKQRPGQDFIDRILQGRYCKMNQIFNEPSKAIPLPRRSGTINVTFSERAFPTPARESSHIEEQEVR